MATIIVGSLYIPRYNGIAWTQPGGTGSQVFPAQKSCSPFTAFPVPGQVLDEVGPSLWHWSCGHGSDVVRIFRDYDDNLASSVALVCCPVCSFVQHVIYPYEQIMDVIRYTIVLGGGAGGFGQPPFGDAPFGVPG